MTTGMLTVTDLIKLKIMSDSTRLNTVKIQDIISADLASEFKKDMSNSVNYYNGKHDILGAVRSYYRDGVLQENRTKANNKLPHPFHKVLVDEKTSYIVGKPLTIGIYGESKGEEKAKSYRSSLMNVFTEKFDDVVYDWVSGSSKKSVEWIHFYIGKDGNLNYVIVPAEQVIPVYDTQYEDRLQYVIRFYAFDSVNENGDNQKRYKVEWWTPDSVEYWTQIEDGSFVYDTFYGMNPSAHWIEVNTSNDSTTEPHGWGRVPFIALWNNSERHTDLKPIKALIDAYDKVKSGWANDLEDFAEVIYVIKGLQTLSQEASAGLTQLGMLVTNIKEDGAISVEADGAVSTIKADIPVEAKEKFLDIVGREIVYFGEGSDVTADLLSKSHAPSGVALQFLYARLDMKAERMIRKLRSALKDFVWFATEYINRKENKSFNPDLVKFIVNKSQIFNVTEKIQSLVSSKDILSMETILEEHPYVEDVQSEMERIKSTGHFGTTTATTPPAIV